MDFAFVLAINVVRIYKFAILARVLISWVQPIPSGRISIMIYQATEPVLSIFRRLLPRMGMIDLSPLIAFLALDFAQMGLMNVMNDL